MNQNDWQPIETAPMDGRWVLGWIAGRASYDHTLCRWEDSLGIWHNYGAPIRISMMFQPTHWMPIPEGPK